MVFQIRQKEIFPVLECEIWLWEIRELRLGILGALSSWLPFITFTKLVELRFAEFVLLNVLLDIKFCFKYWKEIFTSPFGTSIIWNFNSWYYFFKYSFKFFMVKIWSVYFNSEETIIEFSNSFHWQDIILEFFASSMNKFLHFSIGPWVYTTDKNQTFVVDRCSITARILVKYLFHNELHITNW